MLHFVGISNLQSAESNSVYQDMQNEAGKPKRQNNLMLKGDGTNLRKRGISSNNNAARSHTPGNRDQIDRNPKPKP